MQVKGVVVDVIDVRMWTYALQQHTVYISAILHVMCVYYMSCKVNYEHATDSQNIQYCSNRHSYENFWDSIPQYREHYPDVEREEHNLSEIRESTTTQDHPDDCTVCVVVCSASSSV